MKETLRNPTNINQIPHIEILAYVENWLNQKIWYTLIIRLDEKYLLEDFKRASDLYITHQPFVVSARIKKPQGTLLNDSNNK